MTEKSKVSIRNIRRDANEELKKFLKTKKLVRINVQSMRKIFKN